MAITINTESVDPVAVGANVEIIASRVGRKFCAFQVQAPGVGWCKFGGAAAPDDGFKFSGGPVIDVGLALAAGGNNVDFYEGAVNVFFVGVPGADNTPATVNVATLEGS